MASTSLLLLVLFATATLLHAALPEKPAAINSNSVLIALLDSHYTQFSELIEKASLLQTLEQSIATNNHSLTIFAPTNRAFHLDLDPEFKRFLLEPGNIHSLQTLLLHHIVPVKLTRRNWPTKSTRRISTLSRDHVLLSCSSRNARHVDAVDVVHLDSITRPDGVIHGIGKVIVPRAVEHEFNSRRNLRSISAVRPEGAPEIDPRRRNRVSSKKIDNSVMPPIHAAMAPGPGLAPAPAPGPGGHRGYLDGEKQVDDFIKTLLRYGGYNEMADILVNLTNLATEMGKLISEGYAITVLAPNDEAMAKVTADRLSEPGSPEQIVYYHILAEYQTEESMYNAVRRFGTVSYDTLRLNHKIVAREADGSVRFGEGEDSGYLFDPDIYTDGRISVQGIDGVLFPPEPEKMKKKEEVEDGVKVGGQIVKKTRRGKLLEVACQVMGAFGQDSRFTTCQGN